jgi:hypothetical protein
MLTPAASGRSARRSLPASLTSFIGRERELAEAQARLASIDRSGSIRLHRAWMCNVVSPAVNRQIGE